MQDIVWYDLGSGVGKAVLQFALQHKIKRAVGIELARSRHDIAAAALDWLERNQQQAQDQEQQPQLTRKKCEFLSVEKPVFVCDSFTERIYQVRESKIVRVNE